MTTITLYRGGELQDGPSWWTTDRRYAEFYARDGEVHETEITTGRLLDLRPLGCEPSDDELSEFLEEVARPYGSGEGVPVMLHEDCDVYANIDMDLGEAAFRVGFDSVACRQYHVGFDGGREIDAFYLETI